MFMLRIVATIPVHSGVKNERASFYLLSLSESEDRDLNTDTYTLTSDRPTRNETSGLSRNTNEPLDRMNISAAFKERTANRLFSRGN